MRDGGELPQELRERKDGGVELRLKLSSLGEVSRWVLSWAGDAEVTQPRELQEMLKTAARRILNA